MIPRQRHRHRAAPPPRSYGKPMAALALAGVAIASAAGPASATPGGATPGSSEPPATSDSVTALSIPVQVPAPPVEAAPVDAAPVDAVPVEAAQPQPEPQPVAEPQPEPPARAAGPVEEAQPAHMVHPPGGWSASRSLAGSSPTRELRARHAYSATPVALTARRAAAPAPAPQTQPATGAPLLAAGSRGAAVLQWQRGLNHWRDGHAQAAITEDGDFGSTTLAATLAFQRTAGIGVDGVVGPITRGAVAQAPDRSTRASVTLPAVELASASVPVAAAPRASRAAHRAPVPTLASGGAAVALAARYTGVPYTWGGESPDTGFDCSGLVQFVYGRLGVSLPRTSSAQAGAGVAVSASQAQPGDLVFFWSGHGVYHVGIYVGGGRMIAAPKPGDRVKVEAVYTSSVTYRRVV